VTDEQATTATSPRPKRTPPPRRNGHADVRRQQPSLADVLAAVNALGAEVQRLKEWKDETEGGIATFIEAAPEPMGVSREAEPEELTPFVASLRAQTRPTPENFVRSEKPYNYPLRLYAKPDGSIVSLQGDPGNRSYYRDKGFVELDAEQEWRWYGGEKQKVVAVQREKANLINLLREQIARDTDLRGSISIETETAWDHMTVAELEAFVDEVMSIPDRHGKPRRKLRPPQRLIDAENRAAQREMDRLLAGVETTPPPSVVAQFEAEQEHATPARQRVR
jgi:hypothetical protein